MPIHRGLSCLAVAVSLLLSLWAQEAEETRPEPATPELVDGWIFAANDRIYRLDPDGSTQEVKYFQGLRQFGVIPGTQLAVAGAADGIWVLQNGEWVEAFRGPWDVFEFSMNYRMLTVSRNTREPGSMGLGSGRTDEVFVNRLQPKVEDVEGFGGVPALNKGSDGTSFLKHAPGGIWMGGYSGSLTKLIGQTRSHEQFTRHATWIPSGWGELAFRSNQVWLEPDLALGNVWVTLGDEKAPAKFVAADDERQLLYATCAIQGRGYLLRLDVVAAAKGATVVPGQTTWDVVLPLTQDTILRELPTENQGGGMAGDMQYRTPVDIVAIPAPAPYLAYVVPTDMGSERESGRLEWVNLETGELGESRYPVPKVPWQLLDLPSGRMLSIVPSKAYNPAALEGTYRGCTMEGERVTAATPDVAGLVGFGAYRWPPKKGAATTPQLEEPVAKLERFPMEPTGQDPPVAILFIRTGRAPETAGMGGPTPVRDPPMKTYLVMPDGSLKEHRGYFQPRQRYQLSGDHRILVVNGRMFGQQELTGPCHLFTPDTMMTDPAPGVLSSDGTRLWVHDGTPGAGEFISSWDTASGELRLQLPLWREASWPAAKGLAGPEFARFDGPGHGKGGSGWVLADEQHRGWVVLFGALSVFAPSAGDPRGAGMGPMCRTPAGELVVGYWGSDAKGAWVVSPERVSSWTESVTQAIGAQMAVAEGPAPPDPNEDLFIPQASTPTNHLWVDVHSDPYSSAQLEWNRDGTMALCGRPKLWSASFGTLLLETEGRMREIPKEITTPHFTADGKHLLAVLDAQMVDRASPPGRQVVAKIDIAEWKVVWSSQPFTNCEGMFPHPDFDLTAFSDPQAAGL